ncbi:MAG: hypothetical protein ACLSAH_10945 [Bilophila wadsworthia]
MIRTLEASSSEKDKERCANSVSSCATSLRCRPVQVAPCVSASDGLHGAIRACGTAWALPCPKPFPRRAQARSPGASSSGPSLSVSLSLEFHETYAEQERYSSFMRWLGPRLRRIWGSGHFGLRCAEWRAIPALPRSERKATSSRWAASAAS